MHNACAKASKDLEQAFAGRDGNDPDRRRLLSIGIARAAHARARDECRVLELHILNLDLGQGAMIDGELEHPAWPQRVHVDPQ